MTQEEINQELIYLNERQLFCSEVISRSDAHACKCIKIGLNFQETYPDEYVQYISALDEFHANEARILELQNMIPEDND